MRHESPNFLCHEYKDRWRQCKALFSAAPVGSGLNPQVQLKKVPYIAASDPCIRDKGNWGSHVASHPCHPAWTRQQIATFVNDRINERPADTSPLK